MTSKINTPKLFTTSLQKPHLLALFNEHMSERSAMGSDGISLPRFKKQLNDEVDIILRKAALSSYSFSAYREKLILKGRDKPPRMISIPTIRDKLLLKFVSELLITIYPDHKATLPHGIVKKVHAAASAASPDHVFLRLDIQNFYPTVDHLVLMRVLGRKIRHKPLLQLIESAVKTPTGKVGPATVSITKGVPQGLSISNVLASIYLADIDDVMNARTDLKYFRYVDDVLIVTDRKTAEQVAVDLPKLLRRKKKLLCHKVHDGGKSRIAKVSDGMDYLGYHFAGTEIRVRESSYKKLFSNLTKLFTSMKYNKNNKSAIWRLNTRISGCIYKGKRIGWMFYFAQTEDLKQLRRLDYFVQSNCRKFLTTPDLLTVKRFIKAYHEVRFSYRDSKYFPNFDDFDDDQKRHALKSLFPKSRHASIDSWDSERLAEEFNRVISREITDLERDMLDAFS